MSIIFSCESCGKSFTLDDKFAGKTGRCKGCGEVMVIPSASPPPPSPARKAIPATLESAGPSPSPRRAVPATLESPPIRQAVRKPAKAAPAPDLYGFDDELDGPPPKSGDRADDLDDDAPPPPPRMKWSPAPSGSPFASIRPKSSKKSRGREPGDETIIARSIIGLALASIVLMGGYALVKKNGLNFDLGFNFHSKSGIEALVQEKLTLERETTALLAPINDPDAARAASMQVNQHVRGMTANLRKLKEAKGLKTDIQAIARTYQGQLKASLDALVAQFVRVRLRADLWDALAVEAAIQEMSEVEASIQLEPGQVPIMPARPAMPAFQPPPPPVIPPQAAPNFQPPPFQPPNFQRNPMPNPPNFQPPNFNPPAIGPRSRPGSRRPPMGPGNRRIGP